MHRTIFILIILLLMVNKNYSADSLDTKLIKDVSKILAKIEEKSNNTNSISSDFVQEKHLSFISEKVISKGKFYFKRDGLLRWEYVEPYKYLIVINEGQLSIQENDKINSFDINSSKIFRDINDIMISSVSGEIFRMKDKFNTEINENETSYVVDLYPVSGDMNKFISKIILELNKNDCSVVNIQMIEKNNDKTLINFTNRKINEDIPDEKFNIH